MHTKTKVLISGVAALAVAGVGIGVAEAATTTSATPTSTKASAAPSTSANSARRPLLSRVEHGEVTLNGKQHRTVDLQRGTVQAVNATSVTVRSADGFTSSYTINGNTKVRKNKQPSSIDQLAVNDRVTVRAVKNGPTVTADRIGDSGPAPTK